MSPSSRFKTALLAASIGLAIGGNSAMAATPTTTQLPGLGVVVTGTVTPPPAAVGGVQTITVNGSAVINWGVAATGAGTTINADQPGGFNVGSGATENFAGGGSVLNVDISGNASQIFGHLTMAGGGNLFVANSNGIIVGAGASITGSGAIGLIANTLGATTAFAGTSVPASIEYEGSGGNVSVATGAAINGASVLISGGGVVNVDVSNITGPLMLNAGVKNSVSSLVTDNTGASLVVSGTQPTSTLASFASAGDASTSGPLTLGGAVLTRVDGTLTNTGNLTLGTGFNIVGALVNNNTVTQTDDITLAGLTNSGIYNGGIFNLTNNGAFTNDGQLGAATVRVNGGNFVNNGSLTTTSTTAGVYVINGSILNTGQLNAISLDTASDPSMPNYTSGGDYSITNSGIVTSPGSLALDANDTRNAERSPAPPGAINDSLGSVVNTGTLQVGNPGGLGSLNISAYSDVMLGGNVQTQATPGGAYAPLSATNPLASLAVYASDYTTSFLNSAGAATLSTDIITSGASAVGGDQVKLLANLSAEDASGTPASTIAITAGPQVTGDYAVRVAAGKALTASAITVDGDSAADAPNVILQGTLAANAIHFGTAQPVSDVFTGPAGSLSLSGGATNPVLAFTFTGRVKTVPYNNDPNNFSFNGLQVVTDGSPLTLALTPVDYQTNGTSNGLSGVNVLVNGDVTVEAPDNSTVQANGTAVTGVTVLPNTHLVLQSSGNVTTSGTAGTAFYWPGYVYLGNVSADGSGNALPGTLGLGSISTDGTFNNVLAGDVAGASGIHFITQFPLTLMGNVVTNANALVTFGTDLLTAAYTGGTRSAGMFFGGTQGSGSVVNYGPLDPSRFQTQTPVATR